MSAEQGHNLSEKELSEFRDHAQRLRERIRNLPLEPSSSAIGTGRFQATINRDLPPATDSRKGLLDALENVLSAIGVYELYLRSRAGG
jgi:hypothetical protein